MKKTLILGILLVTATAVKAEFFGTNWTVNAAIPDNNFSGWADTRLLDTAPVGTVSDVEVTLNLSGGWNGDLFAYLVNSDSGFSVLLDRVGVGESGVGSFGYGDGGMTVTLGSAGSSIHSYGGGSTFSSPPGGDFLPDASGITLGVGNSGSLGSFTTQGGMWSLFVADLNGGGVTTVQSWGLQMNVTVPEPSSLSLAALFIAFCLKRRIWAAKRN